MHRMLTQAATPPTPIELCLQTQTDEVNYLFEACLTKLLASLANGPLFLSLLSCLNRTITRSLGWLAKRQASTYRKKACY